MADQRIYIRVRIPHSAERVFQAVTDHDKLGEWLEVRRVQVELRSEGGGLGTRRAVDVELPGGLSLAMREEVVGWESGRRMAYRARPNLVFRSYRGELELKDRPDGCLLEWTIHLKTWAPLLGPLVALQVERLFRRGLRHLESNLGPGPGVRRTGRLCRSSNLDEVRCPEDEGVYASLLAEAQDAGSAQLGRALATTRGGGVRDTSYWLMRVMSLATTFALDRVQSGVFQHPCWVLRLLSCAHRYMESSLAAEESQVGGGEGHWQSWLRATANAQRWWPTRIRAAAHSVAKGTYQHISEDYPRALAEVYARSYASRPGVHYDDFLADWRSILPAYDQAWAMVRPEFQLLLRNTEQLRAKLQPSYSRRLLLQDPLLGILRQRELAWERGKRLLNLVDALAPKPEAP